MREAAGRRGNLFQLRAVMLRAVAGVVTVSKFASAATWTVSVRPPTSKVTATERVGRLDDDAAADQPLEAIQLERRLIRLAAARESANRLLPRSLSAESVRSASCCRPSRPAARRRSGRIRRR